VRWNKNEGNSSLAVAIIGKLYIHALAPPCRSSCPIIYASLLHSILGDFESGMGLYPNVAIRDKVAGSYRTEKGRVAKVHPSSVNSKMNGNHSRHSGPTNSIDILCYQDVVTITTPPGAPPPPPGSPNLCLLGTCPLSSLALLLCCGSISEEDDGETGMEDELEEEDEDDHDGGRIETGRRGRNGQDASTTWTPTASAAQSDSDEIVVLVDSWIRLKMSRLLFQRILRCREIISIGIKELLALRSSDAVLFDEPLQAALEVISLLLCEEQDALVAGISVSMGGGADGGTRARGAADSRDSHLRDGPRLSGRGGSRSAGDRRSGARGRY